MQASQETDMAIDTVPVHFYLSFAIPGPFGLLFIIFSFWFALFSPSFRPLSHTPSNSRVSNVPVHVIFAERDSLPRWSEGVCDLSLPPCYGGGSLQVRPDGSAGPASPFSASLPYLVSDFLISSFAGSNTAVQHEKANKRQLAYGLKVVPKYLSFFLSLV